MKSKVKVWSGWDDPEAEQVSKEKENNKYLMWIVLIVIGIMIGMYLKNMNDE